MIVNLMLGENKCLSVSIGQKYNFLSPESLYLRISLY